MDAFEQVVAALLEREGFWIRSRMKVALTKAQKRAIGRHSSPRWELDLVAYRGATNELWIVECKSYLDSRGVDIKAFDGASSFAKRFKLFNDTKLLRVISTSLCKQLVQTRACAKDPSVRLVLAAGRISNTNHRSRLHALFKRRGWLLWDEEDLRTRIEKLTTESYDNAVVSIVSKLLLRKPLLPARPLLEE